MIACHGDPAFPHEPSLTVRIDNARQSISGADNWRPGWGVPVGVGDQSRARRRRTATDSRRRRCRTSAGRARIPCGRRTGEAERDIRTNATDSNRAVTVRARRSPDRPVLAIFSPRAALLSCGVKNGCIAWLKMRVAWVASTRRSPGRVFRGTSQAAGSGQRLRMTHTPRSRYSPTTTRSTPDPAP